MRRAFSLFLLGIVTLSLSSCVTGSPNGRTQLAVGSKYSGGFHYGYSAYIPLPPGEWEVAAVHGGRNNQNKKWDAVILMQAKEGRMAKAIEVWANTDAGKWGFTDAQNCTRKDMHFSKKLSKQKYKAECYWVNHFRMSIDKETKNDLFYVRSYEYGESKGYERPLVAIGPGFWKAVENKYIEVNYFIDPQAYGFDEPKRLDWSTADWHPQYIKKDSDKLAFVNNIVEWAKVAQPILMEGFKGKIVSLPPLPGDTVSELNIATQASGAQQSLEAELSKLKILYESGLFDLEEYQDRKQELLADY